MSDKPLTEAIVHTLSYVKDFFGYTVVVKLGGSVIHNEAALDSICSDLSLLHAAGIKVVLVHGGGKAISQALKEKHIPAEFVDGLRVTSPQAMAVIEEVLCQQVNLSLVNKLQSLGLKAIGLSGSDNQILSCNYYSEQHGQVGVIKSVNTGLIDYVLSSYEFPHYMIPVIAPIGINEAGDKFNVNADYAASFVAKSIGADKLIYLTDQDGIYDGFGERISLASTQDLMNLIKTGVVQGGMMTKVKTILSVLSQDIQQVHILNGNRKHVLINELFTQMGVGTLCYQPNKIKEAA